MLSTRPFMAGCLSWLLWLSVAGSAFSQEANAPQSDRQALAYYADAAGYQNKGAYELAIEQWEKLLAQFPKDPLASKAWHYLGVCHIQSEDPDYAGAIAAFEKALSDKNFDLREESLINLSWALFNRGRQQPAGSSLQKNHFEQARTRLQEVLRRYANGSYLDQALFYLGEIEYGLGNLRPAIAYYSKLLDTSSLSKSNLRPDARYALAVALEENSQESAALKQLTMFLAEHPEHRLAAEVQIRLADLQISSGKPDEAIKLLSARAADTANPLADYALLRLGYAKSQQGEKEQAREHYLQLIEQFPESEHASTAALSAGQLLHQAGQYDEALRQFRKALTASDAGQAVEAAHWMALTLMRQNQPQEAIELIEQTRKQSEAARESLELQMDYADALYALPERLEEAQQAYEQIASEHQDHPLAPRAAYNAAFAALQRGSLPEARRWSETFLNRYPQDPLRNDVAYVAAEALLQQGEHAAAIKAYDKLRETDPQNPASKLWTLRQAMAHYLAGDYSAAIALLQAELPKFEQEDQLAEAQFILGASHLYQGDISAAIDLLAASHDTSDAWPSADEVLLLLAEAHQRNKDPQAAREALELLLKKYPNSRLKTQVDYKLAQLTAAAGNFSDAIQRYEGIVNSETPQTSYHNFATYGIVWCHMQLNQYEQALTRLKPLLAQRLRDSIGVDAKLAEGICLRKLGNPEAAVKALEEFVELKPIGSSLASGLYELAVARIELGQIDQANAALEQIVREHPDYASLDKVLYELAWNHQESGELQAADAYFSQLATQYPESEFAAEATYMLAQQQYESQKYPQAATMYTRVLSGSQDPELIEKTLYKLGWSLYQQEDFRRAAEQFSAQAERFPQGSLALDALFMKAECAFKMQRYDEALEGYREARQLLESELPTAASEQVKSLIYLHGGQSLRELSAWEECERWLSVVPERYADSPYRWTAVYELGFCKQQQKDIPAALKHYSAVAENNRNELGARARFMMGEVYFSERDFRRAIEEFTRVAFGFGGERAPPEIKNWQAKSAFEAARCYEVLVSDLRGDSRSKALAGAQRFYEEIVRDHAKHDLAAKAQTRLGELQKLR